MPIKHALVLSEEYLGDVRKNITIRILSTDRIP